MLPHFSVLFFQHEQFKLKQELAELAIALNMEVHKGRVMKTEVLR